MPAAKSFDWKPLLQKNSIFSTVEENRIGALLADGVSKEHDYAKDKDIVRQGEEGNSLFVIGSGSAEALLAVTAEETIHLSRMGKGDVFGEMAFFGRRERAATVRAKEDCTVLEIGGPEFQRLVDEYPDIRSRLLLLMGERLRDTNEQILALHLRTVDEKLKLFNNRLDNEQKAVDAFLTAAKTVFDQTNSRTHEVIENAERSRDRLTKSATLIGTFVTVLIGLAGLFGWSKVNDATKSLDETRKSLEQKVAESASRVELAKTEATKSENEAKKAEEEAKKAAKSLQEIKTEAETSSQGVKELEAELSKSVSGIYLKRFVEALARNAAYDAKDDYLQIVAAHGLDKQLRVLLSEMELQVIVKAHPPGSTQEKEKIGIFGCILQFAAAGAGNRTGEKLLAYYLLLVYAYLTDQKDLEECGITTRQAAREAFEEFLKSTAFRKYLKSTPREERLWPTKKLDERLAGEPGQQGDELRSFRRLLGTSLDSTV